MLGRISFSPQIKVVIENFMALSVLQVASYVLPLLTFPYLVRVLGPDKFGLLAFAQAFNQYFLVMTDYGFGLSAVRSLSVVRGDVRKVSEIYSAVMCAKFLLVGGSFAVGAVVVLLVPRFREDWLIYLLYFTMVLDSALFPVWFFQGMERMKLTTIFNILGKLFFTVLIFVFVKEEADYWIVPIINSLGFLLVGAYSLWIVHKEFGVRFYIPERRILWLQLVDGWNVFISMVAINLYMSTNMMVLGFFTNNTVVGYFAAGERLIRLITQVLQPLYRALYPYISKLAVESKEKSLARIKQLLLGTTALTGLIFIGLVLSASQLGGIILGAKYAQSTDVILILSPLVMIIPLALILANLTMLPFKLDKYFAGIYISGGVINMVFLVLFLVIFHLGAAGAAYANLFTEVILTVFMFIIIQRKLALFSWKKGMA